MKKILLIAFFFASFGAYAQSDKIVYILSDSVEKIIKNKMDKVREKDVRTSFSCMLFRDRDDVYGLSLFVGDANLKDDFVGSLLRKTVRVVLIDKEKLPLITDYDLKFSSPNLERIGEFGKREGAVSRSKLLFHGYTVFFNSQGEVVKTSEN